MKEIEILIRVTDNELKKSAQQCLAGGLPQDVDDLRPTTIVLDGKTEDDLLYKFIINTCAVYYKASSATHEEFMKKISSHRETLKKLATYRNE